MNKYLQVPFSKEEALALRAGDYVYLSGTIYTARDAAHKRMYEALGENKELPFTVAEDGTVNVYIDRVDIHNIIEVR